MAYTTKRPYCWKFSEDNSGVSIYRQQDDGRLVPVWGLSGGKASWEENQILELINLLNMGFDEGYNEARERINNRLFL